MRLALLRRAAVAGTVALAVALAGAPPAQAAGTGTLTGRLTTGTGAPAVDATVQVYASDGWDSVGWAITDAAGDWTVDGLDADSYLVRFEQPGNPAQYYRQKSEIWDADPITVTAGGTSRADDQFRPTGVITGQIRDTAGAPVADLTVNATEIDTIDHVSARTDAEGIYRLNALPGRYHISFQPIEGSYQNQYVPGGLDMDAAGAFEVVVGAELTVNETVLPTGSLTGRFTSTSGAPLTNTSVTINTANMYGGAEAQTDADGRFTVPTLLAGSYKVGFFPGERQQYYRGKLDQADADLVVVTGGQQTRIADKLLGTGSVRVRAVDSVTGAPIANFCVDSDDDCSSGSGVVTLSGLPQGGHDIYVYSSESRFFPRSLKGVRVRADQVTELTVKLKPGAVITTTVVDRQTGQPVAGTCLSAFLPKQARLVDGYGECSDSAGRIRVGPLTTGTYRLFAEHRGSTYGRQWVGPDGGTGDERQAAQVVATAGQVVAGPQVKLDRAGVISGVVTNAATGEPVANANVSVLTGSPGVGTEDAVTDSQGRYRLTRLGPYTWPVVVSAYSLAGHWSGNATSRFTATGITVTAGGTSAYDTALRTGTELVGTFKNQDGTPFRDGHVTARSVDTGDVAGTGWMSNGQFTMRVTGRQPVFFTYQVTFASDTDNYSGRYLVTNPDGTRQLGRFVVPASGSLAVDLVVPTS